MAMRAGAKPSRAELLAAIVCAFEADETALSEVLRAYRTNTVQEVALRQPEQGNVVRMDRRRPGRRKVAEGP